MKGNVGVQGRAEGKIKCVVCVGVCATTQIIDGCMASTRRKRCKSRDDSQGHDSLGAEAEEPVRSKAKAAARKSKARSVHCLIIV